MKFSMNWGWPQVVAFGIVVTSCTAVAVMLPEYRSQAVVFLVGLVGGAQGFDRALTKKPEEDQAP